jgi:hypothetical protein
MNHAAGLPDRESRCFDFFRQSGRITARNRQPPASFDSVSVYFTRILVLSFVFVGSGMLSTFDTLADFTMPAPRGMVGEIFVAGAQPSGIKWIFRSCYPITRPDEFVLFDYELTVITFRSTDIA